MKIRTLAPLGVFLIPERGNLVGGGKDGVLCILDKNNLGQHSWMPHFNLPFVATYLPNAPNGAAGLPTTTVPDPNWPIVNLDRNIFANTPARKTHHIHGTPVYMETATGGIIYVWGENERLKAYNFNFGTKRITGFRGEGRRWPRATNPRPAACPWTAGGFFERHRSAHRRCLGHVPVQGNANAQVVHGALVAYDATTGSHRQAEAAFPHSDANGATNLGNFAKYSTPVVANGKVYVGTFSDQGRPSTASGRSGLSPHRLRRFHRLCQFYNRDLQPLRAPHPQVMA